MRTVTITVNASKFTGRVFAKAVAKVYEHIKNGKIAKQQEKEQDVTPHGKQSVKELVSQGQGVTSMLSQAAGDRAILAKQLNISPHQLSYVTHSGPGEGLLFYGNVILPFQDHFPKDNELYRIMSTRPGENLEAVPQTA